MGSLLFTLTTNEDNKVKKLKTITVSYADGRTIEAPRYGKVLMKDIFVPFNKREELYEINIKAECKPEYLERAKGIQAKIDKAYIENKEYYKDLQAQEDNKWAQIKSNRNKKRIK